MVFPESVELPPSELRSGLVVPSESSGGTPGIAVAVESLSTFSKDRLSAETSGTSFDDSFIGAGVVGATVVVTNVVVSVSPTLLADKAARTRRTAEKQVVSITECTERRLSGRTEQERRISGGRADDVRRRSVTKPRNSATSTGAGFTQ